MAEQPVDIEIIINGARRIVQSGTVSYDDVVEWSGLRKGPIYSVTCREPEMNGRGWILAPGQSIRLIPGMVINIAHTGNA